MGSKPVALQRRPMKGTYALEERTRAKYDHICNGDEADCRHARQRSAPRNSINSSTPSGERAERNEGKKKSGRLSYLRPVVANEKVGANRLQTAPLRP